MNHPAHPTHPPKAATEFPLRLARFPLYGGGGGGGAKGSCQCSGPDLAGEGDGGKQG